MTRPLERLVALAVDLADDDLGPADLQLVALAAHGLDEHGELQLAAAGDLDDVGRVGLGRRLIDTLPSTSRSRRSRRWRRGEVLAVLAGERRGVDAEGHAQHRLVDREAGQRHGVGRVGEGVADLDLGEAGDDEQVAGDELVDLDAADAREAMQLGEACA